MNKQITVKMLKAFCEKQIKNGNGNRMIVISNDNEGNGFHGLFYGFTPINKGEESFYAISDSVSEDINEIIILG
jgi:hypothetical protein